MSGSELSILIIDENRVRAAIIEDGLREAGHSRITVVSEMSGLVRRIEAAAPDVIVIDLENPKRERFAVAPKWMGTIVKRFQ